VFISVFTDTHHSIGTDRVEEALNGSSLLISNRDSITYSCVEDFRFFDRLLILRIIEMIDGEVIGSTQISDQRSIMNDSVRNSARQRTLPIAAGNQNGTGARLNLRMHLIGQRQTCFTRCIVQ
jgi:hypothetical protein